MTTISNLPAITSATGAIIFPVVDNGITKKMTLSQIDTFIGYTGSGGVGINGYTGSQGYTGFVGSTGIGQIGFTGSAGSGSGGGGNGFTGSQGIPGCTGGVGATGFTGSASSIQGPAGYTGSAGTGGGGGGSFTGGSVACATQFADSTVSINPITGAVTVAGGLGVSGAVYAKGNLYSCSNLYVGTPNVNGGYISTTTSALYLGGSCVLGSITIKPSASGSAACILSGGGLNLLVNSGTTGVTISSSQAAINLGTASASTSTGALVVSGGVGVNGNVYIANTVTAASFVSNATGTPEVYSASNLNLAAVGRVQVTQSTFKVWNVSTANRNLLTPSNGDIIYNTDTNKFQGYAGGAWADLN